MNGSNDRRLGNAVPAGIEDITREDGVVWKKVFGEGKKWNIFSFRFLL